MIVDQPQSHFIFIYHTNSVYGSRKYIAYKGKPLTNKEYLEHWGKWVFLGERRELDEMAEKLNYHVEKGTIPCIKYDRVPLTHLGLNECVMCVYCDEREREEVWQVLNSYGVELKAWFYEKETIQMWSPGGRLLESWIASQNLSVEEAEAVREDSRQRFQAIYDNEDEIFTGWEQ
ncbi:MAG: hypothetical protein C4589_08745 [Peptococcaceae bacterium]|nr:MAG: hypothetical protein C4589_08745 [Peptococcaceae bacterium]